MAGGKSSQSQTEHFTDNRAVLGESSIYANNGASVNNYVLDGGAIGQAFTATNNALNQAFTFGNGAFDFGRDVAGNALATNERTVASALNFGSDALAGAFDSNRYVSQQAFNLGSDALAAAESAYDRALDYSTGATDAALSNLQATQQLTAAAYNDAKGRGALTDKIIIGAIGLMALVAVFALKKG